MFAEYGDAVALFDGGGLVGVGFALGCLTINGERGFADAVVGLIEAALHALADDQFHCGDVVHAFGCVALLQRFAQRQRDRVTRCSFQRGGDLQHLCVVELSGVCGLSQVNLVECLHVFGQRTGFVKYVLIDFAQFFDGFGLNHEYMALGQRALCGSHDGRYGQRQCTWAGDDEHGDDDLDHAVRVVLIPVDGGQRTDDE